MGIETEDGFEQIEFEYQNILDNVSLLDDETVRKLNDVVSKWGMVCLNPNNIIEAKN